MAAERDDKINPERAPDLAPDLVNSEQDLDEMAQAQTVADDATDRDTGGLGLSDTEKVKTGDETDDVQDLVDHMNQMVTSGRLDMSAYRGERNDDEAEGSLGPGGVEE